LNSFLILNGVVTEEGAVAESPLSLVAERDDSKQKNKTKP
jgi:hypothetical protein